jgi:hypothetical protein
MTGIKVLFKKEGVGQLLLIILFSIFLISGYEIPYNIASFARSLPGKIIIVLISLSLAVFSNSILGIVSLIVAFDIIRRSHNVYQQMKQFTPSEDKKSDHYTALNQFPYTLEQEMVKKMAPLIMSNSNLDPPSFKPNIDNIYDASHI